MKYTYKYLIEMGCVYFKSKRRERRDSKELIPKEKEYSWDKRPKINIKDYTIENIVNCISVRAAGTVNGKQFVIQNCQDAYIYVLDYSNTVTIDDCANCKIVLGPTIGSVFIRNCESCQVIALCGQFRARDCKKLTVYLCCPSEPAIESCCKVRVGCCLINYKNLKDQMKSAGLSPFNNKWNLVYDFTPVQSEGLNWRTVETDQLDQVFFAHDSSGNEDLRDMELVLGDSSKSVIPLTSGVGNIFSPNEEHCLICILPGQHQTQQAYDFINSMTNLDGRFELVESRERKLGKDEAKQLIQKANFQIDNHILLVALHFKGHGCLAKCEQVVAHLSLSPDSNGQIFIGCSGKSSESIIQQFMCTSDQS